MRYVISALLAVVLGPVLLFAQVAKEEVEHFEAEIRPLFHEHCVRCHGPELSKAGLRLDGPSGLQKGGERGSLFDRGTLSRSLLLRAISYEDDELQMPPKTRLPEPARQKLERWVLRGAPMPPESLDVATSTRPTDFEARKSHWSLLPPKKTTPPRIEREPPVADTIDAFVLAKLEAQGIEPAPKAEPIAILRRAAYVLTGLPLSDQDLAELVRGPFDAIYPQAIDRWLAGPHFGERFARRWMDVVRFAESKGHEFDFPIPSAWQYRNYLIRAFQVDLPYDRFVLEHLAGDLLEPRRNPKQGFNEAPLGTAFYGFGEECHSPVDLRADDSDRLAEKVDTLSKAFLGLTVACARCHDHKFDAITQADYTALVGVVQSASFRQLRLDSHEDADVARAGAELEAELRPKLLGSLKQALAREAQELPGVLSKVRAHFRDGAELSPDLKPYAEHFESAKTAPSSIWHPWAATVAASPEERAKALSKALEAQADLVKHALPADAVTVADYRSGSSVALIVDGETFGRHAADAGSILGTSQPNAPIPSLLPFGAARSQSLLDPLEGGPAGYPGAFVQPTAGRLLRTGSFRLQTGVLHHLVRGRGVAFVEVDGHRLVNGPLHGAVHLPLDATLEWRWVRQDLSAYAGSRAHVEYVPSGRDSGFAVAQVMDSGVEPASPTVSEWLLLRIAALKDPTDSEIDTVYTQALLEASVEPDRPEHILLVNDWLTLRRKFESSWLDSKTAADVASASTRRQALQARLRASSETAPAVLEGNGIDAQFLARGSPKDPRESIPRGGVASTGDSLTQETVSGSGRLPLGLSLVRKDHPLVARVYVNRLWHWVFERGLVASVDDFGAMGEAPTHPELLDTLAAEFIEQGWSTKKLLRRLLLTEAFQRASTRVPNAEVLDPNNTLLHRAPLRRRDAESLYDALLVASGSWNAEVGGRSQDVHLTESMTGRGRPEKAGPVDGGGRRALYLAVRRNFLSPFLLAFDFPAPAATRGRRHVSNVPAQALSLLNDPFVRAHAEGLARRARSSTPRDEDRIGLVYRTLFCREPRPNELELGLQFLGTERPRTAASDPDLDAFVAYVQVLINTQEFLYLP